LFTRFTWLSARPGIKCNLKILKHFATSWQMKAHPIMSTAKCRQRCQHQQQQQQVGEETKGQEVAERWQRGGKDRHTGTTPTTGRNDFLCQYFSRAHNFDLSSATLALIVLIMAGTGSATAAAAFGSSYKLLLRP